MGRFLFGKVLSKALKGFFGGLIAGEAAVHTIAPADSMGDLEMHVTALGVALVNALVQAGFNAWKNRGKIVN